MTTYEALVYLKKRREICSTGDFVIHGESLYFIDRISQSGSKEKHAICWRVINGQRGYTTSFSTASLAAISPLEGIFIHHELGEDIPGLISVVDWPKISVAIQQFAQHYRVTNDLVLPLTIDADI